MATVCPDYGILHRRRLLLLPAACLAVAILPPPANAAVPAQAREAQPFLTVLGNLVIPPSATPGAGDTSVVTFVTRALSQGMDGAPPDSLALLAQALTSRAGAPFMRCDPNGQHAALMALDAASYPAITPEAKNWRIVKGLILAGYYTSEPGCTKELVYDLAPGRWDNDIPLKPSDRAIANDWFAVSFR